MVFWECLNKKGLEIAILSEEMAILKLCLLGTLHNIEKSTLYQIMRQIMGRQLNLLLVLPLGWGLNLFSTNKTLALMQISPKSPQQGQTPYVLWFLWKSFYPHRNKILPTPSQQLNPWGGECLAEYEKHSGSFCTGTLLSLTASLRIWAGM